MERPIILKAHEVRGILDGRQTQIRPIAKLKPWMVRSGMSFADAWADTGFNGWHYLHIPKYDDETSHRLRCPFGQVGDRLWGRETWQAFDKDADTIVVWQATCQNDEFDYWCGNRCERLTIKKWRSSAVMPRMASRILLEIVSVRVERFNAMTDDDAWCWVIEFKRVEA